MVGVGVVIGKMMVIMAANLKDLQILLVLAKEHRQKTELEMTTSDTATTGPAAAASVAPAAQRGAGTKRVDLATAKASTKTTSWAGGNTRISVRIIQKDERAR